MYKPFFIILAFLSATALAVPLRFDAPADSTKTYQASAYHGETLEIEAQLTWRNAPLAIQGEAGATMLWQTNGMGDVWWTAPASVSRSGLVSATWNPTNDVGADLYRVFLLVAGDGGTSYRANLMLRLLGSPGSTPNALPLPMPFIDFSQVVVTNAPWGAGSALSTNDVQAIALTRAAAEAGYTDWVCSPAAITATVAGTPMPGYAPGPSREVSISFRVQRSTDAQYADYWEMRASQYCYQVHSLFDPDGTATNFTAELRLGAAGIGISPSSVVVTATRRRITPTRTSQLENDSGFVTASDVASATSGLATSSEVAEARADSAAARVESSLVYQLLMGSNVVAEVTNYNSSVRSPQLRLLQLDDGEYKVVWSETNGLHRTLLAANEYADAAASALAEAKADRAWSKYTSGLGADAPSNTTWISTPQTVLAGGYEYAKVVTTAGEAWVLTTNGMNAGPDTNAYFRVATLDGEPLFAIERSDSMLIGVDASAISVNGNTITVPVNVVSAEAPVCYAANSLANATWSNLSDGPPQWISAASVAGEPGAWVWTITTTAPSAFFQFRALQEGRTIIRNNAPAELTQGIWVNGRKYIPVASGTTLTWTEAP